MNPESLGQTILAVNMPTTDSYCVSKTVSCPEDQTLPFMIGSSIIQVENSILILGGGATCFSMGTYWESGVFRVALANKMDLSKEQNVPKVRYLGSQMVVSSTRQKMPQEREPLKPTIRKVPRVHLETPAQFSEMLQTGLPAIIERASFGDCVQKWTPPYMVSRVGYDTKVRAKPR
jgi:tRNA wybutosine-synthesizing protein 4